MSSTASDAGSLEVCELFRSIAGETTRAGLPAAFLRLSGCNLRCRWCDTSKAWEPGRRMGLDRILELLLCRNDQLVVVTGGEPLLQEPVVELCRRLLEADREVLLETNGSLDLSPVPAGVRVILDVKTPSSGEQQRMDLDNLLRLRPGDEVKFVIADRGDFDWAAALLGRHPPAGQASVLFSPAFGLLLPRTLAGWLLREPLPVRLQLQLHKIIWPDGADGESILDEQRESR